MEDPIEALFCPHFSNHPAHSILSWWVDICRGRKDIYRAKMFMRLMDLIHLPDHDWNELDQFLSTLKDNADVREVKAYYQDRKTYWTEPMEY